VALSRAVLGIAVGDNRSWDPLVDIFEKFHLTTKLKPRQRHMQSRLLGLNNIASHLLGCTSVKKYHLMSLKFLHAETFDSIHVTLKISMHVFPQNPKFSPLTLWNAGHTCASGATSTHVWLHAGVHRFREKPGQPRQTRQVRSAKGVHGNQRN